MEEVLCEPGTAIDAPGTARRGGWRERVVIGWLKRIQTGCLTVEFPSGRRQSFGTPEAGPQASLKINDLAVVWRMLISGDIGLAESYMDGGWETTDLTAVLLLGTVNAEALNAVFSQNLLVRMASRFQFAKLANTRRGSRRNIAAHYDLGNEFYGLWLDSTMTYSSGLFEDMDEPLIAAQRRKYRRLAEKLDLRPGDKVLEIGCGWGGFAEIAAGEYGCEVVCLTLSKEQAAFARERMARTGLADRVEIRIEDYRDCTGTYDKIVSIEMFEAVGERYWGTYFETLQRCLKPGAKAAIQSIILGDEYFDGYRRNPEFIQRYIFPGGMLPSPASFEGAVSTANLKIADAYYFGKSYAETLRRWNAAFVDTWPEIEGLGFDARFRRLWHYYLCYCECGFDHGRIDVGQFVIERR